MQTASRWRAPLGSTLSCLLGVRHPLARATSKAKPYSLLACNGVRELIGLPALRPHEPETDSIAVAELVVEVTGIEGVSSQRRKHASVLNYRQVLTHGAGKPELQGVCDQRVTDAHLVDDNCREKRREIRKVQVVPCVDAEPKRPRGFRRLSEPREHSLSVAAREGGGIGLRVQLHAVGAHVARRSHARWVRVHEEARSTAYGSEMREDGLEARSILREVPAVIARPLRRLVRY